MNNNKIIKELLLNCKLSISPTVYIKGNSMNPILFNQDIVYIESSNNYSVGDIILFNYNEREFIIHRIVYADNNIFCCKGDNSFRLEYIYPEEIIGKVTQINRNETILNIEHIPNELVSMSYKIGKIALDLNYNYKKIINNKTYKHYSKVYLNK